MYNKVLFSIGLFIASGTIIAMHEGDNSLVITLSDTKFESFSYNVTFTRQSQQSASNSETEYDGTISMKYNIKKQDQDLWLMAMEIKKNTLSNEDDVLQLGKIYTGYIVTSKNGPALDLFKKGYAGVTSDNEKDCVGLLLTQRNSTESLFVKLDPNKVGQFMDSVLKQNSRRNHSSSSLSDLWPLFGAIGISVLCLILNYLKLITRHK